MLNLTEYRQRPALLADWLPWAGLVAPGVVLNKDGSFQRTARFRGPDLDSATQRELISTSARLNNALRRLGSGWALFVEAERRPAAGYPHSDFPEPLSWLVNEERRAAFEDSGNHFESAYHLTLVYLPPEESRARAAGLLYENRPTEGVDWRERLAAFVAETDRIFDLLDGVMPEIAWLDDGQTLTYLHATISTRRYRVGVPDPAVADEKLRMVERVIQGRGFVTIPETLNAVDAWLSSIPGNAYANVRQPIVSTLNLAHMMPVSAVWAGPEKNEHLDGPPLIVTRTDGATPFRLVTHIGDVGHTLVAGPTGMGKSVLLATLAMQFRRYPGSRIFAFDMGRSMRATVLGLGGEHYDLGTDGEIAFQPLARIDREGYRTWAAEWIEGRLRHEGVEVGPDEKAAIWSALGSLAGAPVEQRTMTGLSVLLQSKALRQALAPYVLGGAHGKLLDADADRLGAGSVQCFEMEELMHSKAAVMAVLQYLFARFDERFDGAPTLLILDEAWLFLDDPVFAARSFLQPGRLAKTGIDAAAPILEQIAKLAGFPEVFTNLAPIVVLFLAWGIVILCFFVLAVQLFVTLIEFKLTTLAGFVLVPFALWNKTAFLAEKVLGNVVASGIKVLVLAVIVGIGSSLFSEFTIAVGAEPSIDQALVIMLASLSMLALGIFGPGIATGLVSGAPQLGAGAMAGAAVGAAGTAVAVGAAATGVGSAVAAGARMAPGAARMAGSGARSAASSATSAQAAYQAGSASAGGGLKGAAAGAGNVAKTGAQAAGQKVAEGARSMKERVAAAFRPDGAASPSATGAAARSAVDSAAPSQPAEQPAWAKRLHRRQQLSHAATTAAHTLRGGDGGGSGQGPSLRDSDS